MSKNVAVFVDVANIFYAAKAAGTDIDYVTLLKSATAGRDFVRAYAYTGLDPENENQRQFHAFLARSGYKVVSKDIRKYGDGRIKANLDIELVVDLMRMATHLDVAVVVSGDGDFAPAIRAVQQMGVRVEVISFRGNTSSDLIEVADVFADITQIARVEKGVRSGRRVAAAAEGDLSMTEVPDKETEGPARRRRPRRAPERDAIVAEAADSATGLPGNLIVLPGERLSRVEPGDVAPDDVLAEDVLPDVVGPPATPLDDAMGEATGEIDADGRRRRRRRGGRGRGRGRTETELVSVGQVTPPEEDEEYLDEAPVAVPQHSTFGSVWDSQLGVPPAPQAAATSGSGPEEEDYEDEPEVPEYLLAERRQERIQRGRGGRGGGGRAAAYRSALDRERYGRTGTSAFGGGGGMRQPDPRRGRDVARPGARPGGRDGASQPRPARAPYRDPAPHREQAPYRGEPAPYRGDQAPASPVSASAEPWSEVPPEVQELLRAELARRGGRPGLTPGDAAPQPPEPVAVLEDAGLSDEVTIDVTTVQPPAPRPARTASRRPRAKRTVTADAATAIQTGAASGSDGATEEPVAPRESAPAPRPRATRARRATAADKDRPAAVEGADATVGGEPTEATVEPVAAPAVTRRRSTRRSPAGASASDAPPPGGDAVVGDAPVSGPGADAGEASPPRTRRRPTRRPAADTEVPATGDSEA